MDYTTHIIAHQYPLTEDTFESKYVYQNLTKRKKNGVY